MDLKKKLILGIAVGISTIAFSQGGPVLTGAPFLRISPDARAGGMGDQGVATTPDAFSQYWNAAKFPFSNTTSAVGVSYTPYMSNLTNDVFLLYAAYHKFLDEEQRSTISAGLYYFNMGEVSLTSLNASTGSYEDQGIAKPNEFSVDVAYGLKLTDNYSMAVTARYVRSDLAGGFNSETNTLKPANTFSVDVSGYYQSPKHTSINELEGRARAGWSIQNLGPKLNYSGDANSKSYLPTMARLGAGYDLYIDDLNKIGITLEASKILVPGPDATGAIANVGVIEGIGKSFNSSTNPQSIMFSGALEYAYQDAFALRGGYFRESNLQGSRQYGTVGVGLKYQSFALDISYLINVSKVNTALDNTLRFGLTWNFGEETENAQD